MPSSFKNLLFSLMPSSLKKKNLVKKKSSHTKKYRDFMRMTFNKTFKINKDEMSIIAPTAFIVSLGLYNVFESFKSKKEKEIIDKIYRLHNKSQSKHLTAKDIKFVESHEKIFYRHFAKTQTEILHKMYFYVKYDMTSNGDQMTPREKEYVESCITKFPQLTIIRHRKILREIKLRKNQKLTDTHPTFEQFREHIRKMRYIASWRPSEDKFLKDYKHIIDKIAKWFNECHHLDKLLSMKDIQFKKKNQHIIELYCEYMRKKVERFEKRYMHDPSNEKAIITLYFTVDQLDSLLDWDPTFIWQNVDSWTSHMSIPLECKTVKQYASPPTNISALIGRDNIIWKGVQFVSSPIFSQVVLIEATKTHCHLYLFVNNTSRMYFEEHELPKILKKDTDYKKSHLRYMMRELKTNGKKTIVQIYAPKGFVN